ncbi:hypothetical protein MTQ17_07910 [Corynebacterium bovis]
MSVAAAAASSTSVKNAATVCRGAGAGSRRSVTSVTTPSVPSDPMNRSSSGTPADAFRDGPPRTRTVPSARTTRRATTCRAVDPDAVPDGPPAFVATLPPTEQKSAEVGSGG